VVLVLDVVLGCTLFVPDVIVPVGVRAVVVVFEVVLGCILVVPCVTVPVGI